jgi:hypothetical protein
MNWWVRTAFVLFGVVMLVLVVVGVMVLDTGPPP